VVGTFAFSGTPTLGVIMNIYSNVNWSLMLSGCAIAISVVSTSVTLLQKRYETLRVGRQQITDALAKIIALAYQQVETSLDAAVDQSSARSQAKFGYVARQLTFYSRHAIFLMDRAPDIVSDADYLALAESFQQTGDYSDANRYYDLAVLKARNNFYKIVNLRLAADALYYQSDPLSGSSKYRQALAVAPGTTDSERSSNGYILQTWALSEAKYNDCSRAAELFVEAERVYLTLQSENLRRQCLSDLRNEMQRVLPQDSSTPAT
jgi:tetratricopeptide (TPR) repeat protein